MCTTAVSSSHGLDPDAEVPVYFLEPKRKLGATVNLSGKSVGPRADDRPARTLQRRQGEARRSRRQAGRGTSTPASRVTIAMVVTPGPPYTTATDQADLLFAAANPT